LFFSDEDFMDMVPFQMDLLRLASAVAQQEQFPATVQPVLAESLEQLACLETAEFSEVPSRSNR
jgi:hypothetical protein